MVRYKVKDVPEEIEEDIVEVKCIHHWIIEPANGATSMGVCKLCGAEREFSNQFKRNSLIAPLFSSVSKIVVEEEEGEESSAQNSQ